MKEQKNSMEKLCEMDILICARCGCEFVYVGQAARVIYCSEECYRQACADKTKKHRLKTLGTTDLSSHRIKDFVEEGKRIKLEKKILHLL